MKNKDNDREYKDMTRKELCAIELVEPIVTEYELPFTFSNGDRSTVFNGVFTINMN